MKRTPKVTLAPQVSQIFGIPKTINAYRYFVLWNRLVAGFTHRTSCTLTLLSAASYRQTLILHHHG